MKVKTYVVNSFGEYTDAIRKIGGNPVESGMVPVLWYRGQSNIDFTLTPSLLRLNVRVERKKVNGDYSSLHYAEDIRTQHYIAKNYHFFQKPPASRVEWLEVMQHHGVNTRVLDWSESSIHSLIFAIEPFLNKSRFSAQEREECIPCVWVLEPGRLNEKIFDFISENIESETKLITDLLDELELNEPETTAIFDSLKQFRQSAFQQVEKGPMDYILNLNELNDEILRDRSRLKYLLKTGNIINPYYYLLCRIYSDGHILEERTLPPLAVVQPYHSERIKAQKGVFTVFPFYKEQADDDVIRKIGYNPDAMENNAMADDCLHKIIIGRPQKIAFEIMKNGMHDSWLYPEMPIVASEIENHEIYS